MKIKKLFLLQLLCTPILITSCSSEKAKKEFSEKASEYVNNKHSFTSCKADFKGKAWSEDYDTFVYFNWNNYDERFIASNNQSSKAEDISGRTQKIISTSPLDLVNISIIEYCDIDTIKYYTTTDELKVEIETKNITKYIAKAYNYSINYNFNSYGLVTKYSMVDNDDKERIDYNITFDYSTTKIYF